MQRDRNDRGNTLARERKRGGSIVWIFLFFVFCKLDLKESREDFCRRGGGWSFHIEEPKMEKAREPTVESPRQGIQRLRASEAERRVQLKTVIEIRRNSAVNRTRWANLYQYYKFVIKCL